MRRWGIIAAAAAVTVILLSACAPSPGPSPDATDAAEPPGTVCAAAAQLFEDGDPEAAIALIDRYRAPALARLEAGAGIVTDAARAVACEAQRDAALLSDPAPDDVTTPVGAVDAWNATLKGWLTPLGTLLAWSLALAAALIVFARLLVFVVPWPSLRPQWRRSAPFTYTGSWWPLPLIVIGSAILVAAWGFLAGTPAQWPLAIAGALVALFATWRTVHWFGGRPRVVVAATGSDGADSPVRSAQVAALTVELGAAGPRSIDRGSSDLDQLSDATAKVSGNALASFVTGVIDFVVNVAPWRVGVTEVDDATSIVEIRWNGRPVGTATIRPSLIAEGIEKVPSDLVPRLQAAVVATTLASHYVDMRGLYGATNWRSVGLAFAAQSPSAGPARLALLHRAIEIDPANALARRQRDNLVHADPADVDATDEYLAALEREANLVAPLSDDRAPFPHAAGWMPPERRDAGSPRYPAPRHLLARTLLLWATALCNRIALARAAGDDAPTADPAADARVLAQLVALVGDLTRENTANEDASAVTTFLGAMRGRTAIVLRRLHDNPAYAAHIADLLPVTQDWYDVAAASGDPGMSYRLACRAAMRSQPVDELLAVAFRAKTYVDWAPKDPELYAIRDSRWALLHPDVPADVWAIEPLAAHREKLIGVGVRTTSELVAAGPRIRKALALDEATFAHLQETARLAGLLEERTPRRWRSRVPLILAALLDSGIDTVPRLRAATRASLRTILEDAVRGVPEKVQPPHGPRGQTVYVTPARAVKRLRRAWIP